MFGWSFFCCGSRRSRCGLITADASLCQIFALLQVEEKTRNGILCTLSGHGWIVGTGSKGTELILPQRRGRFPVVVSSQIDVLPAEGRQVGKVSGLRMVSLLAQVIDRALQVNGVP